MIKKFPSRLRQSIIWELQGGNKIDDWYFLKDHTIIIRYGYFENPFFFHKYVTTQLYSIDMGRQMCAIEIKYGFAGIFKSIIDISTTTKNFNLLELGCKDNIANFIIQNFKLDMVEAP